MVTGKHVQIDEVRTGSSVMYQSDLRLFFGLGKAESAGDEEVKWPTTGKIARSTDVKANQILTIREGSGIVANAHASETATLSYVSLGFRLFGFRKCARQEGAIRAENLIMNHTC
jgi:hypothetical protein